MRRSATAKSDSRCRHGGRWILLVGASPVKHFFCLPLLPGGAIILCHFWNKVVFKQSRGDNAYALCLDISSCIGSKITHNCKRNNPLLRAGRKLGVIIASSSSSSRARARAWGFSELSIRSASAVRSNAEHSMSARYCINSYVRFYANFSFRSKSKRSTRISRISCAHIIQVSFIAICWEQHYYLVTNTREKS